jgi:general stress protein 26
MDIKEMFDAMERILESSRIAVLAHVQNEKKPRLRWMTPTVIRGRQGYLYALSSSDYDWTASLEGAPQVEWMMQSKSLDEIITVRGKMQIIDNPALKADVQEALGGYLRVFWKNIPDESNYITLETVIEEMVYFKPVTGKKITATVS